MKLSRNYRSFFHPSHEVNGQMATEEQSQ